MLDKDGEEIDLKQNFDDEDMGIPKVVDDEAFSNVAVDSEIEELSVEDVPEEILTGEDSEDTGAADLLGALLGGDDADLEDENM